jgi:SAM-dependent methyltransferase
VFVDVASFVARRPDDPAWRAYGQFVRTFLLPLLANRRWGVSLADIYPAHRDGLEPEQVYQWCSVFERFSPQVLSHVSMPVWLRGKARASGEQLYKERSTGNPEKAQFIVESLIKNLQGSLKRLAPQPDKDSVWSNYMATHSYSEPAFAAKRAFVEEALARHKPAKVLDVGANTGTFSLMAASGGAEVVAVDVDAACMGALWKAARAKSLNILPLVVDLSRPSPALGWRNLECASFLDRATGGFDCVLMLAVLHHFLVTERIPLDEVLRLASELTSSLLIIEFVPPDDEMFRHLTRGRDHLHAGLNQEAFEKACIPYYEIITSVALPGTKRRLYALKKGTSSR